MNFTWIIPIGGKESLQQIKKCFNSLNHILVPLDEIIIVRHICDKNSIDHLALKFDCHVKILDHPKVKTAAAARNIALKNCRYKSIIFQDSDDVPHFNRRKVIQKNLVKPGMIVSTGYQTICDGIESGKRIPRKFNLLFYFRTNIFLPAAAIYLRDNDDISFEDLVIGEDTVFFSKLIKSGFVVKICNEITLDYYIITDKVLKKNGLHGIRNEIKYRLILYKNTNSLMQKFLVISGAIFFCFIKLLPKNLFKILYAKGHNSE